MAAAVTRMVRFNKVVDARAATKGMSMRVFSSLEDGPAIDPAAPPPCKKCGGASTHIASFSGKESARCAACAQTYKTKWAAASDSVFVLTLDEVKAVDAAKPRVAVTIDPDDMEKLGLPALAHMSADVRAALQETLAKPAAATGGDAIPAVAVAIRGCTSCWECGGPKAAASVKTLADLRAALLLNNADADVDEVLAQARAAWGREQDVVMYWTNDAGGVMHTACVGRDNMAKAVGDEHVAAVRREEERKAASAATKALTGRALLGGGTLPTWDAVTDGAEPHAIYADLARGTLELMPSVALVIAAAGHPAITAARVASAWAGGCVHVYSVTPDGILSVLLLSRAEVTAALVKAKNA